MILVDSDSILFAKSGLSWSQVGQHGVIGWTRAIAEPAIDLGRDFRRNRGEFPP